MFAFLYIVKCLHKSDFHVNFSQYLWRRNLDPFGDKWEGYLILLESSGRGDLKDP